MSPKEPIYFYLLNHQKEKWYKFYQIQYKNLFNHFLSIKNYKEENQNCKKQILTHLEEDKNLYLKLLSLYYNSLEKELIQYIQKENLYKGDKILEDYRENKNAILESYFNYTYFFIKALEEDKDYQKEIQKWYEVYYILIYELFYQLPESFKKEWFKKFYF
ncbi:MAG: hypothetical protein KatS3mg129_1754 [Leptospiraceae bacterium]|nr:MAG: hypothetical protein KatS3mg129_1754 [Leptospiraceae bacterium]